MKIDFSVPCDYSYLLHTLDRLCEAYARLQRISVGKSRCGRDIPLVRLGEGKKKLLLVGGVHGSEHITAGLLLRFCADYLSAFESGGTVYGLSMPYLWQMRTVYILPMLNPDGAEIAIHGARDGCPLPQALANHTGDFSRWQANAAGVDLNHNFDAGFDNYKELETRAGITAGATRYSGPHPESEPEAAALGAFLRNTELRALFAFHTQGEEIYYDSDGYAPPMGRAIAATLSRLCGYRLARPEGGAAYGGIKDYFIRAFNRPGYTFECGKGENPLPNEDHLRIYAGLRRMLFHLPVLV